MPLDRGFVDQQLQELGEGSRWWNQRELRDLPAILTGDEHILAIARGKLGRPRWLRRPWLFVVTERRLLCVRSAAAGSWRQYEVPTAGVVRVSLRIGPFRARVLVVTSGRTYRLLLPRADAYRLQAVLTGLVQPGKAVVSGFGAARMVRRVVDHVLALPAVALNPHGTVPPPPPPAPDTRGLERRVQVLEDQILLLQQQVDFLEQLLQRSAAERPLSGASPADAPAALPKP